MAYDAIRRTLGHLYVLRKGRKVRRACWCCFGCCRPGLSSAPHTIRRQKVDVPDTVDVPKRHKVTLDFANRFLLHVSTYVSWMIDNGRAKSYDGVAGREPYTEAELERGV